jgi:HlyD family secretion protein
VQASFSAPKLFTLAQDLRQMEITANISEADIGTVEAGQAVSFTVDAFAGRAFQGKIRQVRNNTTIASNVVTYPTIITADNADLKLRPGMTANIVITTSRRANVLRVPNAALHFRPPESAVVLAAADRPPAFDQLPPAIQQRTLTEFDRNGDSKLDADERKTMGNELPPREILLGTSPVYGVAAASASAPLAPP